MKRAEIVRHIDDLGRIVLPMEIRKSLGIRRKDPLAIYITDGDTIALKKINTSTCEFCGNKEGAVEFKEKNICKECLHELKKQEV
ncbi:MAG: AbrB/MazE/SpoVT family DNA-binding domain-containing protein [Oscillospiraceae bacterium]|jgi:transcriptional pleiotropic regulator of transition state genes|nr:AbrB/MazE/SpoVT family DNA-binding domain-containing protein [Oscillospiraceae bacterium]